MKTLADLAKITTLSDAAEVLIPSFENRTLKSMLLDSESSGVAEIIKELGYQPIRTKDGFRFRVSKVFLILEKRGRELVLLVQKGRVVLARTNSNDPRLLPAFKDAIAGIGL